MDRHQTQSWCHPRVGQHLERDPLIFQQSFRYPEYHADDAVATSRTAHRAVFTVDDHRLCRFGRR